MLTKMKNRIKRQKKENLSTLEKQVHNVYEISIHNIKDRSVILQTRIFTSLSPPPSPRKRKNRSNKTTKLS